MKRSSFTETHKISLSKPRSIAVQNLQVCDFAFTLQEFLESNFGGAVHFQSRIAISDIGYVTICPEYFAYVLKSVLAHQRGEKILEVGMYIDGDNKFVVRLEGDTFWDIDTSERHELIRAAHSTRFHPFHSQNGLVFRKFVKPKTVFSVYSSSKNKFLSALNDVFFSGYEEEKDPKHLLMLELEKERRNKALRAQTIKNLGIK